MKLFLFLIFGLFVQAQPLLAETNYDDLTATTNQRIMEDFEQGRERTRVVSVLSYMLRVAEVRLRLAGHSREANQLVQEWETVYAPSALGLLSEDELGDWPPLSAWLAEKYRQLEELVGKRVLEATHLDDINVVNFAVPVVFDPCNGQWDKPEYQKHFVPLAGVASYWGVWGLCMGGTCGVGYSFVCTPAGMASEHVMVNMIAPDLSNRVYDRRCSRR